MINDQILYLPLDSRPCNARFPRQLLEAADYRVYLPLANQQDCFVRPSLFEDRLAFIKRFASNQARLVISIDQWCYGSLLHSRENDISLSLARERLFQLEELRLRFPSLKIHAFSVLMRSSISTLCQDDISLHAQIRAYSRLFAQNERGIEDAKTELQRLEALIPKAQIAKYHAVRDRNHQINLACLSFLQKEIFDSLLILQEDSEPEGLHRLEQEKLVRYAAKEGITRFSLHNGTDEAGMMAAMRAICPEKKQIPLLIHYLRKDRGNFTALYEDRPFFENLKSQMRYLNLTESAEAGSVLAVFSPLNGTQSDAGEAFAEDENAQNEALKALSALIQSGKRVYLLDLRRSNGGDPGLLRELDKASLLDRLWGYASWNTASNALGTLMAQLVSDTISQKQNRDFMLERVLDDCLYQNQSRPELNERLIEAGEDIQHFRNSLQAGKWLSAIHHKKSKAFPYPFPSYRITFPWPRSFEADIRIVKRRN